MVKIKKCVFCAIAAGEAPAEIVREWDDAVAIRPRSGGCTDGHVVVLPRVHVEDASTDIEVTVAVMRRVAELPAANLITSKAPRRRRASSTCSWGSSDLSHKVSLRLMNVLLGPFSPLLSLVSHVVSEGGRRCCCSRWTRSW
ncbi:HIT family protein [Streptomyces sp. DH7]|uniref:HIT family protein n=1 Tax=Streptomyces sp. DH7 TaxID=2857006 RepID=UPI001E63C6A8|nr:hypothetical protein [Streptomyces sp. DH7]